MHEGAPEKSRNIEVHRYQLFEILLLSALVAVVAVFFSVLSRPFHSRPFLFDYKPSFTRRIFLVAGFGVLSIFVIGHIATFRFVSAEEMRIREVSRLTISFLKTAIEGATQKIDAGASTLAGSPAVMDYLSTPGRAGSLERCNAVMDRYRTEFSASVAYVLDKSGTAVSSSNRRDPDSFVGRNYSFRPYFKNALKGNGCSYFAVGVTSGKQGYYRGEPVRDSAGEVSSVAVIKAEFPCLDSLFMKVQQASVVDGNGMVIMSNPGFRRFRPFFTLSDTTGIGSVLSSQFGSYSLEPVSSEVTADSSEVTVDGEHFMLCIQEIPIQGWRIAILSSKDTLYKHRFFGYSVTAALIFCLLFVISLMTLRRVKASAESLYLSEKRFRTIFEHAPEAIIISEMESGAIVAANPLAHQFMRHSSECANQQMSLAGLLDMGGTAGLAPPLTPEKVRGLFLVRHDAGVHHLSVSSERLLFREKKCIVTFLRNISDIIETQKALEASERKYREIAEVLPEGIYETDVSGVITWANRRAFEMFGYAPEDLDKKITPVDLVIPESRKVTREMMEMMMRGIRPNHDEHMVMTRDGKRFPVLVHSTPMIRENRITGLCGVIIDLTERKKYEQELQKRDKLEALGILAGGIAHDFNNILTALWSGLSLLKYGNGTVDEQRHIITGMENAIRRGKGLTGQLLTYSKGGVPIKTTASIEELVRETATFATTGSRVKCVIETIDAPLSAEIDVVQISQVIHNLILNAIEAMPGGGVVTLRLRNTSSAGTNVSPGTYVELVVADTGRGIAQDIQSRIFDPFFSTKPNGSGLGLATAYSIVKNHHGTLFFESREGKGTEFHVLLPASSSKESNPVPRSESVPSGKGRVLLMDDEPTILLVTGKLLSFLGYTVVTAADGQQALALYKESLSNGGRFDAVILDLTIPGGMGGKETIDRLLEVDPQVRAVVSSGYSHDPVMAAYEKYGFKAVITKPYNIQELGAIILSLTKQ